MFIIFIKHFYKKYFNLNIYKKVKDKFIIFKIKLNNKFYIFKNKFIYFIKKYYKLKIK